MIAQAWAGRLVLAATIFSLSLLGPTNPAAQEPAGPSSRQIVSGRIKVNGKSVAPGFEIASGDTVETAKGSSAVVSLGKLGRVEALPASKMNITFDDSSMTIKLEAGAARITKAEGMTATVSTKDATVVAMTPLQASFVVDIGCGNTLVIVSAGNVELRAGSSVKQIAAGSQDSAGQAYRGCKPKSSTIKSRS
ncbi:MAG: hypothetical protein M3539_06345 [Acidobacteriota bacterium]|nr:hypothetical protein [Acidobacteriota bacterium]